MIIQIQYIAATAQTGNTVYTVFKQLWSKKAFMPNYAKLLYGLRSKIREWVTGWMGDTTCGANKLFFLDKEVLYFVQICLIVIYLCGNFQSILFCDEKKRIPVYHPDNRAETLTITQFP